MSMSVKTTAYSNVLHVFSTGEFTLEEAKRTFLVMLNSIAEHRSEKVLFDGRTMTGEPTIIERFYYGEFAADTVARIKHGDLTMKNPKFAYVLQPPALDAQRLGETVAANRGVNVKAFENLDEAISWLGLSPGELRHLPDAGGNKNKNS